MTFSKKEILLFVAISAGVLAYGKVCYESGAMAGEVRDKNALEEIRKEAFLLGKAEGVMEMHWVAEEVGRVERTKKERAAKELWQVREVGETFYLHSEYASPPFLSELGFEAAFHYLYTKDGVYAFPVADFGYEEIIAVLPLKSEEKEPKFLNDAKIQKILKYPLTK